MSREQHQQEEEDDRGCRISENVIVLIRREKVYKVHRLLRGKKIKFDKLSFYPDSALGCYYGTVFEVHCHQLVPVQLNNDIHYEGGVVKTTQSDEFARDNRGIFDDGSAQALKETAILKLREEARGEEVVGRVVEHSTSFKIKTKYSQAKYIDKKKKKHAPMVTIIKPSTKALCEMYYARGPSKICHMRLDTVAQILTYSNVHAHSNMVVMETTQGLLLTAMLERMGGFGNLVQIFFGDFPVRIAVNNSSHLSDKDKSPLLEYPLHRIGSRFSPVLLSSHLSHDSSTSPLDQQQEEEEEGEERNVEMEGESMETSEGEAELEESRPVKRPRLEEDGDKEEEEEEGGRGEEKEDTRELGNREVRERRRGEREERYMTAEALLQQKRMDGLVLACRFHPEPLLASLLGLLAPSRPVVVYCHLLEPLIQCYRTLRNSGDLVVNVELTETWTRHYQVLPERTHPSMAMDGHGGYLLTALTIAKPPPPTTTTT